jgi:hypothetical protein
MKPTGASAVVKHATSAHRLSTVAGKALCVLYTSPVACLRNLLQLVSHLNEVFSFRFAAESSAIRQLDWMTDQTGHTPTANFRLARNPSTETPLPGTASTALASISSAAGAMVRIYQDLIIIPAGRQSG